MPGRSTEIFRQRKIDEAFRGIEHAGHHGFVVFSHLTSFKLTSQFALSFCREGHEHHARSIAVEPMYAARSGKLQQKPSDDAVLLVFATAGHLEQPARFIDCQQVFVSIENMQHDV